MNFLMVDSAGEIDIQRLTSLLPIELRSRISVVPSTAINPALIVTKFISNHQFSIQIDLVRWFQLTTDQQDLLFWHEVAQVERKAIPQASWELTVLGIGLLFGLTELISQNLLALSTTLAVTGLAGYHLYQRHQGERSLRATAAADQRAIALAVQFGYSATAAYAALYSALEELSRQAIRTSRWKKYQVRLRVLEISSLEQRIVSDLELSEKRGSLLYQG